MKPQRLTHEEYIAQENYFFMKGKQNSILSLIKTLNKLKGVDKDRNNKLLEDYNKAANSEEFREARELYFKMFKEREE